MASVSRQSESVWLRVGDVAAVLGVSANTVRRWTDVGRIAAHRSPGGHRRYLAEDVYALLPTEADADGGAQPGDFAELRRQSQDLRAVLQAGLDLMSLLADDPHRVPQEAARMLCSITGAPRCDVFVADGEDLTLAVSVDRGETDSGRHGAWKTADWVPVEGDPAEAPVTCLRAGAKGLDRRARLALRRRGCGSLAWAPVVLRGRFAGAIELSDAGDRDFSRHADVLDGIARVCAEAVAVQRTFDELAERDRSVHELVELSREVAQSHDFERFVQRFAQRLLGATGATCVDVWRVTGGVIRAAVSCTREGADPSLEDKVLDTSQYPSLERTLLDLTPLVITGLDDPRLGADEVQMYRRWGFGSSITMPLVAGGELVGLVDIYHDDARDWEAELEFLTSICQLVAGVFDSTALLGEARVIARLREEVVELGADLAVVETAEDIAERAATRLRLATGCADCDVWWLQEGYIRCLASADENGIDVEARGRVLRADRYPSTTQAIEERQMLIINSLDDERLTDEEREDYAEWDFHSVASVPLVSNDQIVGLIDLYDVHERDFNEVRWFLPEAARTVADALRNADLLAGLRRGNVALRELVELGDRLNEAGHPGGARPGGRRAPARAAERRGLRHLAGGRRRAALPGELRQPRLGHRRGRHGAGALEPTRAPWPRSRPTSRWSSATLTTHQLSEAEREAYRTWGYRSMVSLPLVVEGRPIGLIDVFDTRVRDYTVHLDLIRNVGRLLAGSFEKAMLVERLGEQQRATCGCSPTRAWSSARRSTWTPCCTRRRSACWRSPAPTTATSTVWTATRWRSWSPPARTGSTTPSARGTPSPTTAPSWKRSRRCDRSAPRTSCTTRA